MRARASVKLFFAAQGRNINARRRAVRRVAI
jgi:hypothetical protein